MVLAAAAVEAVVLGGAADAVAAGAEDHVDMVVEQTVGL